MDAAAVADPHGKPSKDIPADLGGRAAAGMGWGVAGSLINRVASLVYQVLLARYLTEAQFGIGALAISTASLCWAIQGVGTAQFLTSRPRDFERWTSLAFWTMAILGLLSCLATVAAAPIATWFSGAPQALWPTLLLVPGGIILALNQVVQPKLAVHLQYRAISLITTFSGLGAMLIGGILALSGAGVYALVIPILLTPLFMLVASATTSGFRIGRMPTHVRPALREMFEHAAPMFGSSLLMAMFLQFDKQLIGRFHDETVVGNYYFAVMLAVQPALIISGTAQATLLPVLSYLPEEGGRRTSAFLRSCRLLLLIGLPACMIQSAAIAPLIHLLFGHRWDAAIAASAILSIGSMFRLLNAPATSLMLSKQQSKTYLKSIAIGTAFVLSGVVVGCVSGGTAAIAVGASIGYLGYELSSLRIALADSGESGSLLNILKLYIPALPSAALSAGAGYLASVWWPVSQYGPFAMLMVCTAVAGAIYLALMWFLARQSMLEIASLVGPKLSRFRGRSAKGV